MGYFVLLIVVGVAAFVIGIRLGYEEGVTATSNKFAPRRTQLTRVPKPPRLDDGYPFEVVGEGSYQATLRDVVGPLSDAAVFVPVPAVVEPEPENPVDDRAIVVRVHGETVGYFSRANARRYAAEVGDGVAARAVIRGGGLLKNGHRASLGIFLADPDTWDSLA